MMNERGVKEGWKGFYAREDKRAKIYRSEKEGGPSVNRLVNHPSARRVHK